MRKEELVSLRNWSSGRTTSDPMGSWNSAAEGGNDVVMMSMKEKVVETEMVRMPRSNRARWMLRMAGRSTVEGSMEGSEAAAAEVMTSEPAEIREM